MRTVDGMQIRNKARHRLLKNTIFFILVLHFQPALSLSQPAPASRNKKCLLILGFGNVGKEVAAYRSSVDVDPKLSGYQIYGTFRPDPQNLRKDVVGEDIHPNVKRIPLTSDSLKPVVPLCSHILVTVPPPKDFEERVILNDIFDEIVALLNANSWIGIVSTTGVYGHHDGNWVDEESALLCQENSTASAFRDFEIAWQSRVFGNNSSRRHHLCIFRCAGIYGPDRSALHTVYKRGLSQDAPTAGITNRIHVHDIARVIHQAMRHHTVPKAAVFEANNEGGSDTPQSQIYNLSDDLPESRGVVMQYAANLLESIGVSVPVRSSPSVQTKDGNLLLSTRDRRRSTELKLVKNDKIKRVLLSENGLLYPTYKEGLQSILYLPDQPWSSNTQPPRS